MKTLTVMLGFLFNGNLFRNFEVNNPFKTNKKLYLLSQKLCELCGKLETHENYCTYGRARLQITPSYAYRSETFNSDCRKTDCA
jgi:hypothetical protein